MPLHNHTELFIILTIFCPLIPAADVVECALRTLRSLTSTTAGEGKEVVHQLLSMLQDSSPS